jgi:hypothetical protein
VFNWLTYQMVTIRWLPLPTYTRSVHLISDIDFTVVCVCMYLYECL